MGFKEKMMNGMMDKMSSEEKNEMMDSMMENFIGKMSSEEKQSMMDSMMNKFFSTMTDTEKQNMMQSMMPKMMGNMMGGKEGNPMGGMMGMMMGGMMPGKNGSGEKQEMPWDMCKKMMSNIEKSNDMAVSATPEIQQLFDDWARQIEDEIYEFVKKADSIIVDEIQNQFKITKESVIFFLNRLAKKEKIKFDK